MTLVATSRHLQRNSASYVARTNKKVYLLQPSGTAASEEDSDSSLLARVVSGISFNYNPAAGSYDAGQNRWELPTSTFTITATSSAIQYQGVLIVSGTPESVDFVDWYASSVTIPAGGSQDLSIALNFGKGSADVTAP